MAELTADIAADVVKVCTSGAGEAAEALARSLDLAGLTLSVGQPATLDLEAQRDALAGPALAVALTVGKNAMVAVLAESTGLVPSWCAAPDATGQSRLTTLAQELGMIVLPEAFAAEDFKAAHVADLSAALARGGVVDGAAAVPLELSHESKQGTLWLLWPANAPTALFDAEDSPPQPTEASQPSEPKPEPKPEAKPGPPPAAEAAPPQPSATDILPPFCKSLLKIKVPVVVTLAEKHQPVSRIIELGPGSIIQFDKACDEMLDLAVGDHHLAQGEAVKVGDKFGLRITSMVLPKERYQTVARRA